LKKKEKWQKLLFSKDSKQEKIKKSFLEKIS